MPDDHEDQQEKEPETRKIPYHIVISTDPAYEIRSGIRVG